MRLRQRLDAFIGPGPDLDQGAQHEAQQHQHGLLLEAAQQPVQELREGEDAHDAAQAEDDEHGPVEVRHGLHDVVVLAHNHENEAARDARQDHRAHGNGTAEEDKEPVIGRLRGRERTDQQAERHAAECEEDLPDPPPLYILEHQDGRGHDQAEEEGPGMHRVVRQDEGHQLGQREDAEHHADGQPEQEGAVDLLPEALEVALEERLPGLLFHQAVQGLYDLLVDARNEGDRAPGYTRYDIGRPHEIALQGCDKSVNSHPR